MDYENDEKSILAFLLLTSSAAALAAPRVITVSRFEVGKDKWAFNREKRGDVYLPTRVMLCMSSTQVPSCSIL